MGISVRVFDSAFGRPAVDVPACLSSDRDGEWHEQARDRTDADGFVAGWASQPVSRGIHRLDVDLDQYFAGIGVMPFYPRISVMFRIADTAQPCHISLLVTPYAYAAYRETPPSAAVGGPQ